MLLGSILCDVLNRNEVEGLFRDEKLTPMCSKHMNNTIFLLQAVRNDIHVVVGSVSKHKTKNYTLYTLQVEQTQLQELRDTKFNYYKVFCE